MTGSDDRAEERAALLAEIECEVRDTAAWLGTDRLDPRVKGAIGRVPREAFVPAEFLAAACSPTSWQ
jgi:protein-L-isoaspartate O-methyltransferase